jgi:aminopeptidase N/puromycin-sensitive aminopeptidase
MKRVGVVVAHEMAHQWFGDMVTMQWWDNLWLNEGFATWMETKAAAKWKPEWNYREDEAQDLDETLSLDSQPTTRTIRAKAETPSEINEMFDGIAYGKAGAVLGMVENYLGEEVFRQGVHNYLAAHLYANATAENFWNAQTANSHQPVDKIMESFVTQPGVPLLTLSDQQQGGVPVVQSRFILSGGGDPPARPDQGWTTPICLKTSAQPICRVLTTGEVTLPLPANAALPMLYVNAGGKGYYRSSYTPQQYDAILAKAERVLTPPERIGLVGDRWALVRSGQGNIVDFMNLVLALKSDPDALVMQSLLYKVRSIDSRIASDEERQQLATVLRREFGPVYTALGAPKQGESYDRQQLRADVFELLGYAQDPEILTQARELTRRSLAPGARKDKTLDPLLTEAAILVTAANGDATFYGKVLAASKDASNPYDQSDALRTLPRFHDPTLVKRTLDYAVSGEVKNQDSWLLLAILLGQRDTHDQTWDYIRDNWEKVHAQFTTNSGSRVVEAAGSFCSAEKRDEVASFFATHKVDAAERTLSETIDVINACVQMRTQQEPSLRHWLDLQGKQQVSKASLD